MKNESEVPPELERIVDRVLAYRPVGKEKTKIVGEKESATSRRGLPGEDKNGRPSRLEG